jgi:hypothetical protein
MQYVRSFFYHVFSTAFPTIDRSLHIDAENVEYAVTGHILSVIDAVVNEPVRILTQIGRGKNPHNLPALKIVQPKQIE